MSVCAESDERCVHYPSANCNMLFPMGWCRTLIEEIAELAWSMTPAEQDVVLARIHALETMGGVCATKSQDRAE